MDANAVLGKLSELGVTAHAEGGNILIQPASKVPPELKDALRENKSELLTILALAVGDGQLPPLDRPPLTEQELRRLIDHLGDPEVFAAWFDWAMEYTDPAEGR